MKPLQYYGTLFALLDRRNEMEVVYRLRMMGMVRYALIGSLEFFEGFHSTHYAGKNKTKNSEMHFSFFDRTQKTVRYPSQIKR